MELADASILTQEEMACNTLNASNVTASLLALSMSNATMMDDDEEDDDDDYEWLEQEREDVAEMLRHFNSATDIKGVLEEKHRRRVQRSRELVAKLDKGHERASRAVAQAESSESEQSALDASMRAQVKEAQEGVEELKSRIHFLENREKDISDKMDELRKIIEPNENAFHEANGKAKAYADLSKNLAGLEIVVSKDEDNVLEFKLTQLHKDFKRKECICYLRLNPKSKQRYQVLRCDPEIEDVGSVEYWLRERSNLNAFVVNLRKAFLNRLTESSNSSHGCRTES